MAIRAGASNLVRFHLQRGGDINRQDDSGTSLLMFAALRGRAEICQILLDAGADPVLKIVRARMRWIWLTPLAMTL